MKPNTKTIFQFTAVAASFISLVSCFKSVPEGQPIKADGYITERTSGDKAAGVMVYLYGGHSSFESGVEYGLGPLDSAISDENGHFLMQYKAEGKSVDYALSLRSGGNEENVFLPYEPDDSSVEIPFNYQHQITNISLKVRKTNNLQLHLSITSVPRDSLFITIYSEHGLFSYNYLLRGHSVDTVLPAKFIPGEACYFQYYAYSTDTLIDGVNYHRQLTDTLQPGNNDNVQVTKNITSTNDFPLQIY